MRLTSSIVAIVALAMPALADDAQDKSICADDRAAHAVRIEACTRLLSTPPTDPGAAAEIRLRRGIAYFYARNYDAALADFDQAIDLKPGAADFHSWRASTLRAKGDYARAVAAFDKTLELRPDTARTHYLRGETYYRMKDYARALADLERALTLQPGTAEYLYPLANIHIDLKQYDKAVVDLDAILGASPFNARGYSARGNAHEQVGDKSRALRDYKIALLLDPNLPGAEAGLARLSRAVVLPLPDRAIEFLQPKGGRVFRYVQVETKVAEKSDADELFGDLFAWFRAPPLPVARRGTRFDLTVTGVEDSTVFATTHRVAAFPPVATPVDQSLALYRGIWPQVWPGPMNARMVIAYDRSALDSLWPLRPERTAKGMARATLANCPEGEDAARAAVACPAERQTKFGTLAWTGQVLRWEQVVVPAGIFAAAVIRYEEDAEYALMGQTGKRRSVSHFWYAPEIDWWVKRTVEANGLIAIVELVENN